MVSVDRWVENDGLAYLVLSTLFITTTVCMTYALGYYEVSIATAGTWAGTEGAAARTLHMLQEGTAGPPSGQLSSPPFPALMWAGQLSCKHAGLCTEAEIGRAEVNA